MAILYAVIPRDFSIEPLIRVEYERLIVASAVLAVGLRALWCWLGRREE